MYYRFLIHILMESLPWLYPCCNPNINAPNHLSYQVFWLERPSWTDQILVKLNAMRETSQICRLWKDEFLVIYMKQGNPGSLGHKLEASWLPLNWFQINNRVWKSQGTYVKISIMNYFFFGVVNIYLFE